MLAELGDREVNAQGLWGHSGIASTGLERYGEAPAHWRTMVGRATRRAKRGSKGCWPLHLAGLHPLPSALSSQRGPPPPGALFLAGGRDTSLLFDRLGGMSVPPGSFRPPRLWRSISSGRAGGLAAAPASPIVRLVAVVGPTMRPAPEEPVAGGSSVMVAQSLTLGCQPRPWRAPGAENASGGRFVGHGGAIGGPGVSGSVAGELRKTQAQGQ